MKIAICDDNEQDVARYTALLTDMAKRCNIPAVFSRFTGGAALLFAVEDVDTRPDLVFLDIHMPGTDGMEVAEKLKKMRLPIEIVFLTVSQDHLYDAFDLEARNYIVKDVTPPERFERVFLQGVQWVQDRQADTILLTCAGRNCNIRVRDISYFEVQVNLLTVHYTAGEQKKKFEFFGTMARVEELLWGKGFLRAHRAFLVSKQYIAAVSRTAIQLLDGVELPVGRSYYTQLCKEIGKGDVPNL